MSYDFGYTWVWTHGHLVPFGLFGALAAVSAWRRWPRWVTGLAGVLALWALAGFGITQIVLRANRPMELPTASFLRAGTGRVLDLGAGSGRSSLMVLLERPKAHVTAVDIYRGYFGIDDNTPERLLANARVAGVSDRIDVKTADIRELPFAEASYDAAVSAFAIDHLNRDGVTRSLAEVRRVLRPGGEFLLIVLNVDAWARVAYPLPHGHGYFSHSPALERWTSAIETAGLEVVEHGTQPVSLYVLCRKPGQ
jgi:SAM-dependent methyltransferase